MVDERLTTVSAHRALNVTNVRGDKRKGIVDAVSAVLDSKTLNDLLPKCK